MQELDLKNPQENLSKQDKALLKESLPLNHGDKSQDENSHANFQQCKKCKNYNELFLTKPGSSRFEFTAWVLLFPVGPFYSIWRHLSPKKSLCRACASPSKKPVSKIRIMINLTIMIAILAALLVYKDVLIETYRQIQLINESLKNLQNV